MTEENKLGGFIISSTNAQKVISEIVKIFEKYNLDVREITYIVEQLNEAVDETNKFKNKITSIEVADKIFRKIMKDEQIKGDL